MNDYTIIGGGVAGLSAARAIATKDYGAPITIITSGSKRVYAKQSLPLIIKGSCDPAQIQRIPDDFYVQHNIKLIIKTVQRVDVAEKRIIMSDGTTHPYKKLLITTGTSPIPVDAPGAKRNGVVVCTNLSHAKKIRDMSVQKAVVIGSGEWGMALASALATPDRSVTIVEKNNYIIDKSMPQELQTVLITECRKHNVSFILNDVIQHFGGKDNDLNYVETSRRTRLEAQLAVVTSPIRHNVDLVEGTAIKKRHGIIVDEHMQTTARNIWAAGSVVELYQGKSNQSSHIVNQADAISSGIVAGKHMSQDREQSFVSQGVCESWEICGKQYHRVGVLDVNNRTKRIIHSVDRMQGTFLYIVMDDGRMIGMCSFGRQLDIHVIEQLIASGVDIDASDNQMLSDRFDWSRLLYP